MPVKDDWAFGDQYTHSDANDVAAAVNANESGLTGKAATVHSHAAGDVNSGTLHIDRIPTGTSGSTVCLGNDARLSNTRTPTDNTVTPAKLHSTVFGTSAGTACQGDDARLAAPQAPTYQTGATLATAAVTSPRHRVYATAQNTDIAIANPSGSPTYGWQVMYEIIASGADRAIGYGTNFVGDDDMPTTAKNGKLLRIGFEWSPAAAKWVYMGKRELP